jgi:ElaB/YqjD/DUF883 family membrane-anchored ribosome-binding protein
MAREFTKEKMDEALEFLEKAAQKKKKELHRLVNEKYSGIKNIFQDGLVDQIKNTTTKAMEAGEDKVKEIKDEMEKKLKDNPWPFMGGVALGCLLLGYILRKS